MEKSHRKIGSRRHALGMWALHLIKALRLLDTSRAKVDVYGMMTSEPGKWNISNLSQTLCIDRKSVREILFVMHQKGHVDQVGCDWEINCAGRFQAMKFFNGILRQLPPDQQSTAIRFFRAKYPCPMLGMMHVFVLLSSTARRVDHPLAQSAVVITLIYLGPHTNAEISTRSGLAYKTVHKETAWLVKQGYAKKIGRKFEATTMGHIWDFWRFIKVMKTLPKSTYLIIWKMAIWSTSPNPHPDR